MVYSPAQWRDHLLELLDATDAVEPQSLPSGRSYLVYTAQVDGRIWQLYVHNSLVYDLVG
jgi:hypothetical protein